MIITNLKKQETVGDIIDKGYITNINIYDDFELLTNAPDPDVIYVNHELRVIFFLYEEQGRVETEDYLFLIGYEKVIIFNKYTRDFIEEEI